MKNKLTTCIFSFLVIAILAVGCSHSAQSTTIIELLTYDSFNISDEILDSFQEKENIKIKINKANGVGELLAILVLTKDRPVFDVVFGIDNTFVQRALKEELFVQYRSGGLDNVNAEFQINDFVTPVDYGDVCVNYLLESFSDSKAPDNLDDLILPEYKGEFVTQHPETSSPGLAFLLATIAKYGEDEETGWKNYWRKLKENDVLIRSSWSDAYYTEFLPNGGRSIVTSYASSPVAEVFYNKLDTPPTGVILDGCFRQVEYAGILAKTKKTAEAQKVIDLFLSKSFQEDIPLQLFVYPVSSKAVLPDVFLEHTPLVENSLTLPIETIAEKRDEWTEEWVRILFR